MERIYLTVARTIARGNLTLRSIVQQTGANESRVKHAIGWLKEKNQVFSEGRNKDGLIQYRLRVSIESIERDAGVGPAHDATALLDAWGFQVPSLIGNARTIKLLHDSGDE